MRDDIRSHLELHQPYEVTTGFDRPNLYFETRRALPSQKPKELLDLVLREGDNAGIVYCSTTKQVDETARLLQSRGIRAAAYHAKLDADTRRKNQDDFLYDRIQIMVATNAFGMGIDKPNVRFVIHYNMPKDLESYYQEAGRAGRDGLPSRCILLYSGTDVRTIRFFIDKEMEADNGLPADVKAEAARKAEERLKYMTFYSTTQKCLRRFMLNYFGEAAPEKCGNCSCCLLPSRTRRRWNSALPPRSRGLRPTPGGCRPAVLLPAATSARQTRSCWPRSTPSASVLRQSRMFRPTWCSATRPSARWSRASP